MWTVNPDIFEFDEGEHYVQSLTGLPDNKLIWRHKV